jgi:NAD+ kinase
MGCVLLVVHQHRSEALRLASDALAWLESSGHEARLPPEDAAVLGRTDLMVAEPAGRYFDLAISIGGDGTMLRTVDLVSAHDVPVLGIHVGQLGYLVEVEPSDYVAAIQGFFAGTHEIEERMRLEVTVEGVGGDAIAGGDLVGGDLVGGGPLRGAALNEAVLEKTPLGHTVRLRVDIDGEYFTTYVADGLIVATPTGSTAYALSARAPIVAPGHRALVLTPVAPHQLFDRTLVLKPTSQIRIRVTSYRPAKLFLDGRQLATLQDGMALVATASRHPARLVTFTQRNFLAILKTKFGLNDR